MTDYNLLFVSYLVSSVVGNTDSDTHNMSIMGTDYF